MDYLIAATILLYMASTAAYLLFLFLQKNRFFLAGKLLLSAGFLLNFSAFGYLFLQSGHFPARNLHQTLLFSSAVLSGAFLVFQFRFRLKILGVYVAPLAATMVTIASFLPSEAGQNSALFKSFWMVIHLATVFCGYAAFTLAFGIGILYLMQEKSIKSKHHGFFYKRLPSLDLLDSAGYACIVAGFTLLSIGLASGFIFAKTVWGRFFSWDPKEVWSCIVWLVYGAIIHGRLAVGWRGRRAAIMAIIGFLLLLFTFFGVNFLLEGHHGEFTRK